MLDACHPGVVLRAVALVELVAATAAMFFAASPAAWLAQWTQLTAVMLPATLLWLLAACGCKQALARRTTGAQLAAATALGALAGLCGCALLALARALPLGAGLGDAAALPWLASACTGALLALAMAAVLALRARGRMPAATAARLAELQARIRPHFLFNTLNSAIALVRAEPAKAEALLEDLGDLFRHALADPGQSTTLAQEIELAQRYLAIEQVRFGDRLRVRWAIDPSAGGARLPPLLLQPLVENAVVHGVEPSAEGGRILVSTERRGALVVVKIENTLPPARDGADAGPDPAAPRGHGIALDNVRARLQLMHDVESRMQAGPRDGKFRVRLQWPLEGV
ncbi:MAG: histidine kinase [Xylophilus ampelinus]